MVDKSWGTTGSPGFRVRTNDGPEHRAAERARAREARAAERVDAMTERLKARTAARETDIQEREQERVARRERETALAVGDPHAAAAQRHRRSGRKDVVREQRDTRAYTTTVDIGRMRELHKRGASITGLAGAFGITVDDVERALAGEGAED